jgi:hypothetical protein
MIKYSKTTLIVDNASAGDGMAKDLSQSDLAEMRQTPSLFAHVFDNNDADALGLVFTMPSASSSARRRAFGDRGHGSGLGLAGFVAGGQPASVGSWPPGARGADRWR